ncbi:MAG: O-antigen ligase family protein [Patescibacteria group bacterium]
MLQHWLARWPNQIFQLRLSWNLLIFALIFLTPTHFFLVLDRTAGYVNGVQIDYLVPKLYLVVCIAAAILCWWLWFFKPWKVWRWSILIQHRWTTSLVVACIIAQLSAAQPSIAFWFLTQAALLIFSGWLLVKNRSLLYKNTLISAVSATTIFQVSIALWQWTQQQSLLGYALLGEVDFNRYLGLAKTTHGAEWILPYGTTAHPNVLGGFLAIMGLGMVAVYLRQQKKQALSVWKQKWLWFMSVVAMAGILLTQSAAALLTFSLGSSILIIQTTTSFAQYFKIGGFQLLLYLVVLLCIPIGIAQAGNALDPSWQRRIFLNQVATQMIVEAPITGVGLNHFTLQLESFSVSREFVRFIQPAHHTLLLYMAETGTVGMALLLFGLWKLVSRQSLSPIYWGLIPVLALDHYLLTMPVGVLSISLLAVVTAEYY